ncbi:DUF1045 domain-containing protein [Actibacterium sp. 188UL27-1]|uniref:DUF1045 domain-containing protein n=1 Tax=Actibacterium sp. 188UL27-1 TaxID=2786961 RepID=UPI0019562236|nr:DUF1045 domain-containing protein [Actibacterium sp. 188UL27-1]MBM7067963.1 DUF1045 domain-containing protein [Actibacterium sp. 188UL27-1]
MDGFTRYAIYFTPTGGLASFGAAWLGWDNATGTEVAHPQIDGLPRPVAQITDRPRKYGFHGTIKPPFHLAKDKVATALEAETRALCARLKPVELDGLQLAQLGQFLAVIPDGDTTALARLAATFVEELDHFRAPPSEAELARRRGSQLSPPQEDNLARWGYPYVMDQFRFHLTLSGPMEPADLTATHRALDPYLAPHLTRPYRIDTMSLLGADQAGRFHIIHRYTLAG